MRWPTKIFWRADVVEGRHVVEADQQVIDEGRRAEEEFLGVGGDDEVLWEHLQHLVVTFERRAHVIVGVPKVSKAGTLVPISLGRKWVTGTSLMS